MQLGFIDPEVQQEILVDSSELQSQHQPFIKTINFNSSVIIIEVVIVIKMLVLDSGKFVSLDPIDYHFILVLNPFDHLVKHYTLLR